jgi:hypothetical protein
MKNLRWDDESWIKMYTRDPAEFLALSFDASSLLLHLWRKLDKTGVFAVGDVDPHEVPELLALTFRVDVARMEAAVAELVRRKFVVLAERDGQRVVFVPDYEPAQSARASDRLRQQEKRKRDREDVISSSNPLRSSRDVTRCHALSRGVTDGHAASRVEERRKEENRPEGIPPTRAEVTQPEQYEELPPTTPSLSHEPARRSVLRPQTPELGEPQTPSLIVAPLAPATAPRPVHDDPDKEAIRAKLASMAKPMCLLASIGAEERLYGPVMNGKVPLALALEAIDDAASKLGYELASVRLEDKQGMVALERRVAGFVNNANRWQKPKQSRPVSEDPPKPYEPRRGPMPKPFTLDPELFNS